jgi:hypothetical protein
MNIKKENPIVSPTVHFIHILSASSLPGCFYGSPTPSIEACRHGYIVEGGRRKRSYSKQRISSNTGFDLRYFNVTPAELRVPRIPLALFRDTRDDSMENQETWALNCEPTSNDILSQIISILIET